ncbi:ribosomal protein L6e-domain-containing protein [Pelagophyceae sp. CCMP2097]|nr:ribosomal protein L6e-domain-containing protein [Pelagophyceae sp. CCMP2097]|mmetsp:Transcript_9368/g.30982  ORF Transcript_9368/g.30982 Transcript_9368/m.30982 type:complete len:188 (-) Transcript_9368:36-599(-)
MAPKVKGEKRAREPRFYPAYDVPAKKANTVANVPQVHRASLTPGTVLILLAGRFRGKRVVMLKALDSGLLLVSGPFCVNGVPIRRVNAAYVIATSTTVDISKLALDAKFCDAYFPKKEKAQKVDAEGEFFTADAKAPKPECSAEKKADQAALDAKLLPLIEKTPMLKAYLCALFTLKKGMKPHEMVF